MSNVQTSEQTHVCPAPYITYTRWNLARHSTQPFLAECETEETNNIDFNYTATAVGCGLTAFP